MHTKVLTAAVAAGLIFSAAPASATVITVQLDAGNPYDDIPQIEVDGVPVVLNNSTGQSISLLTEQGLVNFGDQPDGSYTITFPTIPLYQTVNLTLPMHNPSTGAEVDQVDVFPKRKSEHGSTTPPSTTSFPQPSLEPTSTDNAKPTNTANAKPTSTATPGGSTTRTSAQQPNSSQAGPGSNWLGGLASTGANVWWLGLSGGLLILFGFIVVLASRRRAERAQENAERAQENAERAQENSEEHSSITTTHTGAEQ